MHLLHNSPHIPQCSAHTSSTIMRSCLGGLGGREGVEGEVGSPPVSISSSLLSDKSASLKEREKERGREREGERGRQRESDN